MQRDDGSSLSLTKQGPQSSNFPWLPKAKPLRHHQRKALGCVDVFVDDEVGLGQGSPAPLKRLRQILMQVNDLVLCPNLLHEQHGKEPMSVSKMAKGDAQWTTLKVVLGWLIDALP